MLASASKIDELISKASKEKDFAQTAVFMAKAAESSERYDEMCKWVVALVNARLAEKKDLTEEQRNLLSVGYKHVVGFRRSSFRCFQHGEHKENDLIKSYKQVVKGEVMKICMEVLDVLQKKLIPNVQELAKAAEGTETEPKHQEACIFYLKMVGDYYRYLAEVDSETENAKNAEKFYVQGSDLAEKFLPSTHPIRLGLSLNLSVCYYEILKNQKKACELAKKAFDQAIAQLDSLDENSYKDSTLIMQLLRDNLNLWTARTEGEGEEEDVRVKDIE
uniref:14-3-3 domain-containing protein n=1 Tax=Lotharella oceanica TaxID=641309 RepID=A0A7S2TZK4_9EUKA|mmetsp:Transcript_37238/g.68698  ORF Transcript_37238/g.68698 Transcript_37238/m.68698 type:complete len:276 (+) Transcript_37238:64-891(+)